MDELSTCKCGEDKPVGASMCHDCIISSLPNEAFMDVNSKNVVTLKDMVEFLAEKRLPADTPLFFEDGQGVNIVVTEKSAISFCKYEKD